MRARPLVFVAVAGVLGLASVAHADFDPDGRRHHKPPVVVGPKPPVVKPAGSTSPATSTSVAIDSTPKKDPIRKATIIALARPGESGPVLKLAQLYRERDGSLDKGIVDWKARADDTTASAEERWAAKVTWAGLLHSDKREREAAVAYEAAIADKPDRPVAMIALARLRQDSSDLKGAYELYEKALPLHKDKTEREATLRALMELAVDRKDKENATKWHADLVKQNGDSMAVRGELGRLYQRKGELELAEGEFETVVKAAAGDNRTLPAALLDLGLVQTKLQKYDVAISTLEKGLGVAGSEAGVRPRLLNAIAECYRAQNRIEELVAKLEKQKPGDVDRQELIGKLAAEFDAEKAIGWLSKALASAPGHVDTRILLIRLLKEQSRLDEAVTQYDALISSAKGQPQFVLELCDLLIGRGDRPKCLARLKGLEASGADDPEILERLASYYSQIGEDKLALALMEKLATKGGDDPSYLVDLGDYYYQRSETAKAKEIWKRLLVVIKPKAKALAALGEVYLDHDLGEDALVAYKEAIELSPSDVMLQKGHAAALERVHRVGEAQFVWETILRRNDVDHATQAEARRHLVILWLAQKKLADQVTPLTLQFNGPPVDLEAGRLLAEVLVHLRRYPEAEKTLRAVIKEAPGDVEARIVLERALVQQGDLAQAIKVLEEVVKADPKGARQYYQRMAQYALALYRDEDALKYAAAAVELQPDDPDGHKKLAEMYRSQQDFVRAIKEFKLALQHNPKLWPTYFELAELLLAQGQEVEADALYRRVMRGAGDDDLVGNAIRLSAAINQKRGTLEVLETELLPITLGSPQKVVYRRLLVELYDNLTAPLIQKARLDGPEADAARARLVKIGARGVQPMIDALGDADVAQQQIAIELLGRVENKSAALPLFAYAIGRTTDDRAMHDPKLAARAMMACGALGDLALLPKLDAYLFPKSGLVPHDEVATGAAFGVARIVEEAYRGKTKDKHAEDAAALAQRLVESVEPIRPEMRIYAAIGLGRTHDPKRVPALRKMLEGSSAGPAGRAAALWALSEIGDETSRAAVLGQAETATDPSMREIATLALARQIVRDALTPAHAKEPISPTDARLRTLAEASLDGNPSVRRAGTIALAVVATKSWRDPWTVLPIPIDGAFPQAALTPLTPTGYTPADFAAALVAFERPITSAARSALETSKERAAVVLDAMLVRSAGASFGLFNEGAKAADPSHATAARIADAAEELVAALVHHPDRALQAHAIRWLGARDTKGARAALVDALGDLDAGAQRLAVDALQVHGDATTVTAIAGLLADHKDWSMRAAAARALGAIGHRDASANVTAALETSARSDASAFVREEALVALSSARGEAARATLEKAAKDDVEPRVRERASKLLSSATHG